MSRQVATTISELAGAARRRQTASQRPHQEPEWELPNAVAWTREQLAALLGVTEGVIRSWHTVGRKAVSTGKIVYLKTLLIPYGRYAPCDVAEFLSAVNGMRVVVGGKDAP